MSTDLESFLAAHPLDVDVQLVSWHADDEGVLRAELEGFPWWLPRGEDAPGEVRFRIEMRGVRSSNVQLCWRPTDIEDLGVVRDDPLLWAYGTHATIFGNSPVPDPARLFLEYWDLVHERLHARSAADLRSSFVPFTRWAARVGENRMYHLLEGPLPLMEACRPLLDAQGVQYVLITGPERRTDHLRVVWIGDWEVVCSEATIEFPDPAV